jgi:hypothetical protein
MDKLARLSGGEVFPAESHDLGPTIIGRYVRRRRRAS